MDWFTSEESFFRISFHGFDTWKRKDECYHCNQVRLNTICFHSNQISDCVCLVHNPLMWQQIYKDQIIYQEQVFSLKLFNSNCLVLTYQSFCQSPLNICIVNQKTARIFEIWIVTLKWLDIISLTWFKGRGTGDIQVQEFVEKSYEITWLLDSTLTG